MTVVTPFDNKVGAWLVAGNQLGEASIDELAQTILTYAPAITQVWVKTSDGSDWMAKYDNKPSMWIDGPAAVDRWVSTLQKYGLEFCAWCVPHGTDIQGEASVITQVCQRPGVRSMILDVEPYNGFYAGNKDSVRALMTAIRSRIPGAFHIGLTVDSRGAHKNEIFPDEWSPFIQSVHPQVYWADFQNTPDVALAEAYKTWGNYYDKPVIPALSGYNTDARSITQARNLCVNTYHAVGWSWWVLGHMGAAGFNAANFSTNGIQVVPPPGTGDLPAQQGTPIVVTVGSPNYQETIYPGTNAAFLTQPSPNGVGKYKAVDDGKSDVVVSYDPHIKQAGFYKIEAYVPAQHATTGNARYKIHGIKERPGEFLVSGAQCAVSNNWLNLGIYQIDPTQQEPGKIYLTDWTLEIGREIAWDAMRWTPMNTLASTPVMLNIPYRSQEAADARRYRNDCGPACIGMLLDWQAQTRGTTTTPISTNQLSSETTLATSDTGLNSAQLVTLAAAHGLKLKVAQTATIPNIVNEVKAGRPVLCLISYAALTGRENQADTGGHFLLVTGYDANNIYVNDPDWWNQGAIKMEQGHNWKIPMTQFSLALRQAEVPHQGCFVVS